MWQLLKDTVSRWYEANAPRMGASLAYYTVFSMAPLLVVAVGIAGFVFGKEAAQQQVMQQMQGLIGSQGSEVLRTMMLNAAKPSAGIAASVIGLLVLLFGASGVFLELRSALNTIWGVKQRDGEGLVGVLRSRFFSFAMVLAIGFLLLVSLTISAWLAAAGQFISSMVHMPAAVLWVMNFVIGFVAATVLFALIYRVVPDAEIAWRDVWAGGAVTALLFSLGRFLIGVYLGTAGVGSAYGAAASLVILLAWVYYSAQVFFLGAEFTHQFALRHGSKFRGRRPGNVPRAA